MLEFPCGIAAPIPRGEGCWMPARATAELRSFGLRRSAGACCRRLKSVLGSGEQLV